MSCYFLPRFGNMQTCYCLYQEAESKSEEFTNEIGSQYYIGRSVPIFTEEDKEIFEKLLMWYN